MRPRRITALWRASAAASYLLASRQDQCHGVGAFAITAAAHEAIIATLPQDKSLWPLQCQGGQRPSRVEAAIVNRLAATRGPEEAYNGLFASARIASLAASCRLSNGFNYLTRVPPVAN